MRSLAAVALGVLVGAAAVAAPRPKDRPDEQSDLKKLAGEWTVTSYRSLGIDMLGPGRVQSASWSFDAAGYTLRLGEYIEQGSVKLDQTKKVPTIDIAIAAGADRGQAQVGIYQLDGDTLTLCLARAGVEGRPTDIASAEGTANILITMKRKK